jgi:hypothetical protein
VVSQVEFVVPTETAVKQIDEAIGLSLVESSFECNFRKLKISARLKWLPRFIVRCCMDRNWCVGCVVDMIVFKPADFRRFTTSLMVFYPYVVLSRVIGRVSGAGLRIC